MGHIALKYLSLNKKQKVFLKFDYNWLLLLLCTNVPNAVRLAAIFIKKLFIEIDQVKFFYRSCKSCVSPPEVFTVNHLFDEVSMVQKDGLPLAALRFMAGKRI